MELLQIHGRATPSLSVFRNKEKNKDQEGFTNLQITIFVNKIIKK